MYDSLVLWCDYVEYTFFAKGVKGTIRFLNAFSRHAYESPEAVPFVTWRRGGYSDLEN